MKKILLTALTGLAFLGAATGVSADTASTATDSVKVQLNVNSAIEMNCGAIGDTTTKTVALGDITGFGQATQAGIECNVASDKDYNLAVKSPGLIQTQDTDGNPVDASSAAKFDTYNGINGRWINHSYGLMDTAFWGISTTTGYGNNNEYWVGIADADTQLSASNLANPTGRTHTYYVGAEIRQQSTLPAGSYEADLTFTATAL